MTTYRSPRLFVELDLPGGGDVPLSLDQARYLAVVMRRPDGAPIRLFNGRDGEWAARFQSKGKRGGSAIMEQRIRGQDDPDKGPWIIFAAVKRAATELIVEKATELGAARIVPVRTERSNVERMKPDRLIRIAREAAEQSERVTVPEISELIGLRDLLAGWPPERLLIVGDETGRAPPILEALQGTSATPFGLLVGPEGGFAESELDALGELDFVRKVGLGPRVLRAETAAIAGLALGQAALGDLRAARAAPEVD